MRRLIPYNGTTVLLRAIRRTRKGMIRSKHGKGTEKNIYENMSRMRKGKQGHVLTGDGRRLRMREMPRADKDKISRHAEGAGCGITE